jgi:hypothetical protein
LLYSNYPEQRSIKDNEGHSRGVMGSVSLLNTKKISDQPIVSFDWSADKAGLCVMSCLDQTVKIGMLSPNYKFINNTKTCI